MAVMDTYTARVERDGRFWLIHVPQVDRYTQARHLREVEPMVRDLVAVMLDVDPASFAVAVDIALPKSVTVHMAAAGKLRDQAAEANHRAAEEARAAA